MYLPGLIKGAEFAFYNMVSCVPVLIECAGKLKRRHKALFGLYFNRINCFFNRYFNVLCIGFKPKCFKVSLCQCFWLQKIFQIQFITYIFFLLYFRYIQRPASNGFCAMEWVFKQKIFSTEISIFFWLLRILFRL